MDTLIDNAIAAAKIVGFHWIHALWAVICIGTIFKARKERHLAKAKA